MKTKNGKKLKVKALVDSRCIHIGIDEQLVKDKRIQMKLINFSFEVFNADGTKNGEVTRVAPLEIEINGYKKQLEAAVTDLDGMDMFLGHNWLVKHNLEVNWKNSTIRFTVRCSSHWGRSLQNGLGDEQTCGTTLASAYVLRCLSATWSQL